MSPSNDSFFVALKSILKFCFELPKVNLDNSGTTEVRYSINVFAHLLQPHKLILDVLYDGVSSEEYSWIQIEIFFVWT